MAVRDARSATLLVDVGNLTRKNQTLAKRGKNWIPTEIGNSKNISLANCGSATGMTTKKGLPTKREFCFDEQRTQWLLLLEILSGDFVDHAIMVMNMLNMMRHY